jgi:hypothetical protein
MNIHVDEQSVYYQVTGSDVYVPPTAVALFLQQYLTLLQCVLPSLLVDIVEVRQQRITQLPFSKYLPLNKIGENFMKYLLYHCSIIQTKCFLGGGGVNVNVAANH